MPSPESRVFVLIDDARAANAVSFIQSLPKDGSMEVEIRPRKKPRSQNQNAALWGVAYPPIMEAMGLRGEKEREEIHEYFCGEYFGWVEYQILDKRKVRPKRTTTKNEDGKRDILTKMDMSDFFAFVQQRAADNGIYVPDPDPLYWVES